MFKVAHPLSFRSCRRISRRGSGSIQVCKARMLETRGEQLEATTQRIQLGEVGQSLRIGLAFGVESFGSSSFDSRRIPMLLDKCFYIVMLQLSQLVLVIRLLQMFVHCGVIVARNPTLCCGCRCLYIMAQWWQMLPHCGVLVGYCLTLWCYGWTQYGPSSCCDNVVAEMHSIALRQSDQ